MENESEMNTSKKSSGVPSLESIQLSAGTAANEQSQNEDGMSAPSTSNVQVLEHRNSVEDLARRLPTPPTQTPDQMMTAENTPHQNILLNSSDLRCSITSSSITGSTDTLSAEKQCLQNMMTILQDNQEDVIPLIHDMTLNSTDNDDSTEKPERDGEEEVEDEATDDTKDVKISRRKSMQMPANVLKKVPKEPYKIDIPLNKKINASTKKKLWREIERRKPFITKNVASHIQQFAKPPFITWGCKSCHFPYEVKSYSNEYWNH